MIRWADFSLVVFDEVHHSVKQHPYQRLLTGSPRVSVSPDVPPVTRHHDMEYDRRPKLLGLTASPAGKSTLEDTYSMLRGLLTNIGR